MQNKNLSTPSDIFEIRDHLIDSNQIKEIVETRIEQRRQQAKELLLDPDNFIASVEIEKQLQESAFDMIEAYKSQISLKPYQIPSNIGLRDKITAWLKKQAHNLVIYYANLLGRKQILFNENMARVILIQQKQITEAHKKIEALETELQTLGKLSINKKGP